MKTFIISSGGSGGHMFPAVSLAHELRKRRHKVILITDARGRSYAGDFDPTYVLNLRNRWWGIVKGFFACLSIVSESKPNVVVGFGSYASVPAVLAAQVMRVPTLIHEQNAVMGKANRLLAPLSRMVVGGFPLLQGEHLGNPIRPEFLTIGPYTLPQQKFRLLVLGGSQGAEVFSKILPQAILSLPPSMQERLQIFQQCRPEWMEATQQTYQGFAGELTLSPFFDPVHTLYEVAHLVISRAGASTIAELAAAGRPALFVPLVLAGGHQKDNAAYLVDHKAAFMMDQYHFTAPAVAQLLGEILQHPRPLAEMAQQARMLAKPRALEDLADRLEQLG